MTMTVIRIVIAVVFAACMINVGRLVVPNVHSLLEKRERAIRSAMELDGARLDECETQPRLAATRGASLAPCPESPVTPLKP